MIFIIMGVSGSGKTSIASALHQKLGWPIAEADDYHPDSNKAKMKQGIPLTDEDREPWLLSLHKVINKWSTEKQNGIVTCSALKRRYRDILRHGNINNALASKNQNTNDILFVLPHGSKDMIQQRMSHRKGHFMPTSLLNSQFDTLELPEADENALQISIEMDIDGIVNKILEHIKLNSDIN